MCSGVLATYENAGNIIFEFNYMRRYLRFKKRNIIRSDEFAEVWERLVQSRKLYTLGHSIGHGHIRRIPEGNRKNFLSVF